MFLLDRTPFTYSDPWRLSFDDRFGDFAKGDRRVAYFYENPDTSTFRYRVYNMIQVLRRSGKGISAAYFCEREMDRLDEVVDMTDVLVICRARYTDKLDHLVTRAKNKGKLVIFDVDDLVFDLQYVHLILATLDQELGRPSIWDEWYAYIGRIGAVLRMCDRVIVPTDYLASRVSYCVDKPVSVIPNFLNQEQMVVSARILEEKQRQHFARTDKTHLGYFSGTPTHNKDFEIISNALARLLEEDARLMILIVGFMNLKGPLLNYSSRIEHLPLQDFVNLQRLIGSVEINLVPLQDNIFTNCKSELKYFEAGIAGTVSIASPTSALAKAIRAGDNGYIANSFEWYDKLQYVLSNIDSYSAIAERAAVDSEQKYSWRNQLELIENTLFN